MVEIMFKYEMKKIFSKPFSKIICIILIVIAIILGFFNIRDEKYVTEDGEIITGISASHKLKEVKNQYAGNITTDVLVKVIEENQKINEANEYMSDNYIEENKAFSKKQGFSDIMDLISTAFSDFQDYDYYKANSVSTNEVGNLYEKRISNLKDWLNSDEQKGNFSDEEKQYLISQYNNLNTPLYYEYADGWKSITSPQYTITLIIIAVVMIGFLVAGIFSDEFKFKADSIFFSTKLGRNKAIWSKIKAGFITVTLVYFGILILYSIIVLGTLGVGGANCPIQIDSSNWESIYNITFIQKYILIILGGYIGSLFILTFSMFISAKSRSTVIAATIPFALSSVAMFLGRIPVFTAISPFLPNHLLMISNNLDEFMLYKIGGKVVGFITIDIVLYLILYFIIVPVIYRIYKKAEVK